MRHHLAAYRAIFELLTGADLGNFWALTMIKYTLVFLLAIVSCLFLTPWVMRLAVAVGAVDHPDSRRVHSVPTPRFGGLAVFTSLGISLGFGLLLDPLLQQYGEPVATVILTSAAMMLLGLADDCFSVRPTLKLLIETLAALAAFAVGCRITELFGWRLGWAAAPVTVLWMVGVSNAFNLIDGLDGLATGVGTIISATLFALCVYDSQTPSALVLAALCGSLSGFLCYNFFPAKIFLGDSGSLLLGFIFALVSVRIADTSSATFALSIPMLALGLPLGEMMLTLTRRLLQEVHVMRGGADGKGYEFLFLGHAAVLTADRAHIHHRLLDLGITHRNVVFLLYAVCSVLCGGALILVFLRGAEEDLILGMLTVAGLIGVRRLGYKELQLLRNGLLLPFLDAPLFNLKPFRVLLDLASVAAAYLASYLIWSQAASTAQLTPPVVQALPLVCFGQIGGFAFVNLYKDSYHLSGISDLISLIKSLLLAEAIGWSARFLVFGWQPPELIVVLLDTYLLGTMVISWRFSLSVLEHYFQVEEQRCDLPRTGTRNEINISTHADGYAHIRSLHRASKQGTASSGDGL